MSHSVLDIKAIIVSNEVDNRSTNISICRRCQNPFTRDKSASKGSANYYRCPNCLTMATFTHDLMMSCSIQ